MSFLKRIEISGYKSIEHANIELRKLNVLIGANGAGKSNLISLFKFIYEIRQNRLQEFVLKWGANSLLYYGAKVTQQMQTELHFEGEPANFKWKFQLIPTARDSLIIENEIISSLLNDNWHRVAAGPTDRGSSIIAMIGALRALPTPADQSLGEAGMPIIRHSDKWGVFHFGDTSGTARIRLGGYMDDNVKLHSDGSNLAAMLHKIQKSQNTAYYRITETIRQIAPWFGDFILEPIKPNETNIKLNWRDRYSDNIFGPHQLPDGALRAMALITLLLQPWEDLPSLIIIDEPELGLHPSAITVIAALLQQASLHAQVIVATQSPTFLDEFDPEDVIVVDREKGKSTFTRQDSDKLRDWLEEYSLGELWQKNSIGGGPF
jgi:predicted ATPase